MATNLIDAGSNETHDMSFWTIYAGGTASAASSAVQAHTGTRSIRLLTPAASDLLTVYTAAGVLADAGRRCNFWVYLGTLGSAYVALFDGSFNPYFEWQVQGGTGLTYLSTSFSFVKICNTTMVTGRWYRVTISYVVTTTTNYTFKVFVDGVLDTTMTQADATLAGTGLSIWSLTSKNDAGAGDVFFTETYIDPSTALTDPGAIRITAKRPIANGSSVGFTTQVGAGGSGNGSGHTPQVNERPASDTNGWSRSNTTRQTEEYSIEGAGVGDVAVNTAQIIDFMGWIRAKVDSTANSPVHRLILANTTTAKTMSTSVALYTQFAGSTTYPAGNTDIGMDAQYTTTPHVTSLLECGIVVAFIPTSEPQLERGTRGIHRGVMRGAV